MGSAEAVCFADGFGDLIKKNLQESLLLCCQRIWEDFAGEGVDDIGDKGQV